MDIFPVGFRSCSSCTRSCFKEHQRSSSLQNPCFVKALCDSNLATMATCWMVIPSAWLKLYGDEVENSATLHGPSGNTWQVGVGRPKWVAFRVGWRTFAADNGLEKGDMLVFTLIGKSEFSVKIFDNKTCLEKECALTATNTGCYDSRSPVQGEKRKQRDDVETALDLRRIYMYNDNEDIQMENNKRISISLCNEKNAKLQPFNLDSAHASHRDCGLVDAKKQPIYLLQSPDHKEGRKSSEVHHQSLNVVGGQGLQQYTSVVVFRPHPISVRTHDNGEKYLSQGQSKALECASGGVGPATRFASQRRPVVDSSRDRNLEPLHRQSSSGALITSEYSSQILDLYRNQSEEHAGLPILSPAVILGREKALEIARHAQQDIDRPSHLVVLRAFHVHGRAFVRFPVTFGKQHMPRKTVPMHLLDRNGHRWPMSWLRDNETHMGLTRGWRDYCLAEGLSEGDVCVFELIELHNLTLRVHVFCSTEARNKSHVVIPEPASSEFGHARHHSFQSYSEKRRVSSDKVEKRHKKETTSSGGQEIMARTSKEQNPLIPPKMVLYNAFYRMPVPSSTRLSKGSMRQVTSPVGSVGRERLKTLSLWATKEQEPNFLTCFRTDRVPSPGRCSENNLDEPDGDFSKVQETTCSEILCQMSSGCINEENAFNHGAYVAKQLPPGLFTCGMQEQKVHHLDSLESIIDQPPQEGKYWTKCSVRSLERGSEQIGDGFKSGCNIPRQWAKTRKRYRKQYKTEITRGWTWCTPGSSTEKRNLKVSKVNPRLCLVSKRSPVTDAKKEAAKHAAHNLKSENPAALVVMKKSNVYKKFTVELPPIFPRESRSGQSINVFLYDAAGHRTIALLTEKGLSRGWERFSLEHLLEEGDVCIFEFKSFSHLSFLVHIFRVVEVDHTQMSYRDHYHIIYRGLQGIDGRRPVRNIKKKLLPGSNTGKYRENICNKIGPTIAHRSLYLAIQKTRAKHRDVRHQKLVPSRWKEPLDLNCNPAAPVVPLLGSEWPTSELSSIKKISSVGASLNPAFKISLEMDQILDLGRMKLEGDLSAKLVYPTCDDHHTLGDTSPIITQNDTTDIVETTSESWQMQSISPARPDERVVKPLPTSDDDDSEAEEGNYYRVVRVIKKRYFKNEKQYLTELDGPVLQRDGCGALREYEDIKWWIPEKSFTAGFASCYLR